MELFTPSSLRARDDSRASERESACHRLIRARYFAVRLAIFHARFSRGQRKFYSFAIVPTVGSTPVTRQPGSEVVILERGGRSRANS